MHVSLPMYDPPHLHRATDTFWAAVAAALPFDAPRDLTRNADPWALWQCRDMFLSQTCGLPYRARLHGQVHLVATPDYGLEGCAPGYYRSVLVTRQSTRLTPGLRLAYNDPISQSGWAAAQGFGFAPHLETGAHESSMNAVLSGAADVALIDCHTLRILGLPEGLATQGFSDPSPAPPFITSRSEWMAPLRKALKEACDQLDASTRQALGLRDIIAIDAADYLRVPIPPAPSA